MKARQLIVAAAFPPDALTTIFRAFDAAWEEVAGHVDSDPSAIESARLSLANIVLSLATAEPLIMEDLKATAVELFRLKHRL